MKDLGEISSWPVGVRTTRDRTIGHTILDQENYIEEVLRRFNISDAKLVSILMGYEKKLNFFHGTNQ